MGYQEPKSRDYGVNLCNGCLEKQRVIDRHLYCERNLCERFWSKVKQYRRVATRFEKKAVNFLAFVKVAAMMVMLK